MVRAMLPRCRLKAAAVSGVTPERPLVGVRGWASLGAVFGVAGGPPGCSQPPGSLGRALGSAGTDDGVHLSA